MRTTDLRCGLRLTLHQQEIALFKIPLVCQLRTLGLLLRARKRALLRRSSCTPRRNAPPRGRGTCENAFFSEFVKIVQSIPNCPELDGSRRWPFCNWLGNSNCPQNGGVGKEDQPAVGSSANAMHPFCTFGRGSRADYSGNLRLDKCFSENLPNNSSKSSSANHFE